MKRIWLGTLLGAGVPLVQGLNVARKSIGNQILVDAVSNSIERVKEGSQLAKSLADCRDLLEAGQDRLAGNRRRGCSA